MLLSSKKDSPLLFLIVKSIISVSIIAFSYSLINNGQMMFALILYSILILYYTVSYKKIYGYIIVEHLNPFMLCIFAMIFVLLAQYLIKHIDKFLGKGLEISILIEMVYYSMAAVIALAVPMAMLVCTLMAFGRLSSDNEITAMKSSGIQYFKLVLPPLIFSSIVAIIMIYFNNWILPNMNYESKKLLSEISTKNLKVILDSKQLNNQIDGFSIYFENEGKDNTKKPNQDGYDFFKDVVILEKGKFNKKIKKTITSNKAYKVNNFDSQHMTFLLENGSLYQDLDDNKYQIIKFEKNQFKMNMDQFSFSHNQRRGDRELDFKGIKDTIKWHSDLIDKCQQKIKRHIRRIDQISAISYPYNFLVNQHVPNISAQRLENEKYYKNIKLAIKKENNRIDGFQKQINKFLVEMHKKFSLPIACIVFILVGAPLGVTTRKGKFSISIGISVTFFIIYWAFLIAGENFADKGSINPVLAMWLPNIILFIIGIYFNYKINAGEKIYSKPTNPFKKND